MAALWRICEVLGPAVLRLVSSPDGAHAEIGEVSLHDPGEPVRAAGGDLVLAVGSAESPQAVIALIERAAEAGVAAVAVKPPAADHLDVCAAADAAGIALLRVEPEVTWGQLYLLARAAVASAGQPVDRHAASIRLGDLFAVADAIAARAGGPITIEDARSRVLAYSNTPEEELDEPRRQTILGRGVPAGWLQHLEDTGVFRRLWAADDVVEMPALPEVGLHRRLAVRVRAGKHVLGAIWLAEGRAPLGDDAAEALSEAAQFVALHLLAHQSKADVEREVRGNLLRQVLDGGGSADLLAERLGIRAEDGCCVVAFRLPDLEGPDAVTVRDSVVSLIALHSEAFRWQAASIWIGETVYTLLPTDAPPLRVLALAKDLVERIATVLGVTATAGVGSTVPRLEQAAHSRREADQVLRALAVRGGSAATIDEVSAQRVLLVLSDLLDEHPELASEKVHVLRASDAEHGTVYVETLRAYLDAFGSIPKAAEDLGVHPNTLRYRLRRALELADLDLEDGDERVVVELGLRLLPREDV
jgi:hypothetical protein